MAGMTAHDLAELIGILAGFAATIGSLFLAYPLFHLLRAREAIEDLERNLDGADQGDDRFVEMRAALHDLRIHVRRRRRTAIRVGAVGVILLIAATALLFTQGALLYL